MNGAFSERDCITVTANTKFILVSWDVARPGLWYGVEVFGSRSQFKTMERTWSKSVGKGESITTYTTINYDNVQEVGSKLYFDSLNSNRRPYYCVILAMGTLENCMRELKRFEDLTLRYPLVPANYLTSKDNLELLSNPNIHNSCRCEPIRINRIAETVLKSMEHAEKLARSAQQKRGPPIRQLHLCANKRQKKE
jgi:hypothetical protein